MQNYVEFFYIYFLRKRIFSLYKNNIVSYFCVKACPDEFQVRQDCHQAHEARMWNGEIKINNIQINNIMLTCSIKIFLIIFSLISQNHFLLTYFFHINSERYDLRWCRGMPRRLLIRHLAEPQIILTRINIYTYKSVCYTSWMEENGILHKIAKENWQKTSS